MSGCPLVMECKWVKTVQVPKRKPDSEPDAFVIIGEVLSVRVSESVLSEGVVDVGKLRPVARLGYSQEYTVVREALDL